MNLRDLSLELSRHAATLHGLTDTNVESVAQDGGMVLCDFDTSKLEGEIDDLKISNDGLAAEVKGLTEENAAPIKRAECAEELLDSVESETELDGTKGATLREIVTARDEWKRIAEENRTICEAARAELVALRKRKGVTVNLFKCEEDILSLLGRLTQYPEDAAKLAPKAKAILIKLYAK